MDKFTPADFPGAMTPEEVETFVPPEDEATPESDRFVIYVLFHMVEFLAGRVAFLEEIHGLKSGDGAVIDAACIEVGHTDQLKGRLNH